MKEGRAHGRRKIAPRRSAARRRAHRSARSGGCRQPHGVCRGHGQDQGSDGLRVLLDAMKVAMVGVQFDEATNTATCASRIQYVLHSSATWSA